MATVFDIAAYIKSRLGSPGRLKLNKLAYYVQAWSLVWRGRPAFVERIEAWKDGPVVRALWTSQEHGASQEIRNASPLPTDLEGHIDRVLLAYGHLSSDQLSELTHREDPWNIARGDTASGVASDAEITHDAMIKFYGHRWVEAERDNAAAQDMPAFVGSVDDFEKTLTGS